jgi:F-type H+-transporting ATPase subunit epsilon
MDFELLTLGGAKYRGKVAEVALRTASGQMAILPNHEPLTAITVPGPVAVRVHEGGKEDLFATFGGLLEVTPGRVRLLADEAEHADELIHQEVEAALEKAQHLKAEAKNKHELHRAQQMIDRHHVRLEVVRLRRRHRNQPRRPTPPG